MEKQAKYVLITGCSSGIGYTTAHYLNSIGYAVIASARKQEDVVHLHNEGLIAIQLDLAESTSVQAALNQVEDITNGKLYALFNNGGYGQPGAVEDLPRTLLERQFQTNLFGTHELTCGCLVMMRRHGEQSVIIQNSSVLGLVAIPYRGAYNASKFALEGLTDTLRNELRGSAIRVVTIEPGPIATKFRPNSCQQFLENIDQNQSAYKHIYPYLLHRLQTGGSLQKRRVSADQVAQVIEKILRSPNPKAHYYITTETKLLALLRRLLPVSWLDRLVVAIANKENGIPLK